MSSFSEKVNQIMDRLGPDPSAASGTEGGKSNTYLMIAMAVVPLTFFGAFYLIFKPKEGEERNYKKILMMTLIASLVAIPLLYLASINGYLPL
jgi:hypothetical protein